jgi:AcrR family transcriptional regulator
MLKAAAKIDEPSLSHNLLGQRLGRKGRGTRERILAATAQLLAEPSDAPISLSAVAREASLGMTTLYLYFSDLTELLLAALEPIMASAEGSYIAHLRARWPDHDLAAHSVEFVQEYHAFWKRHTRILHLRNSLADANDARMRMNRIQMSQPLIQLLVSQMDDDPATHRSTSSYMATVLLTGIERIVTVATDAFFSKMPIEDRDVHVGNLLIAEARLLELAVRDRRAAASRAR